MTDGPLRVWLRFAACLAVGLVFCLPVKGDSDASDGPAISEMLVLKNGDRVSGTSLNVSNGILQWKMPYGGGVEIPLELVERIEQLSEELVPPVEQASASVAAPPSAGSAAPVAEVSPEPKNDAAVEPAAAEVPAIEEVPAVVEEPLPITKAWYEVSRSTYTFTVDQTSKWTKRFELGGTWVDGNSETTEVYIGGQFERQFERISHSLDWNGRHTTAGEKVTQSRWQFNGTTDFSKDAKGKWILFLTHRHLFDQLADLDYRGTFAGGVGYRFINEGDKRLIARLGPGATVEKYSPPLETRVTPDLFAEAEAKWPLFDRTLLEYKSTFTPSLDRIGVFRMTSNYGLLVRIDEKEAWAMRVGLRHDHNSEPNPGTRQNDFTTTLSVVYTRK